MNTLQFATLGGIVAILTFMATAGEKFKGFMTSVSNLWLERINIDDLLSASVYKYCLDEMSLFGIRTKVFSGCVLMMKGKPEEQLTAFDILKQTPLIFRKGLRILILKPGEWRFDPSMNDYIRTTDLLLPRIMWNSVKLIEECVFKYNDSNTPINIKQKRFKIRRFYGKNKTAPTLVLDETKRSDVLIVGAREMIHEVSIGRAQMLGYNLEDIVIDDSEGKSPFEWYAFPQHVLDSVENVRQWFRSRHWYKAKRVAWRRGWLIYGTPGTGKTLLAKCVAQDLDIPVFLFDIASMNNEEFETFWGQASMHTPCMILFEDFDAVFHGRDNVTPTTEHKLTFDCLLNCISGIESNEGVLMILTTNHIEHMDPSMGVSTEKGTISSRPGRIDDVIQLSNMDEPCRIAMTERILGFRGDDLASFVKKTDGMTAAQFTEMCNRTALQMIFEKNGKEIKKVSESITV